MSFKIPGLDKIKDMFGDKMKDLSLQDIFSSEFVQKYTNSSNINELLTKFGINAGNVEELAKHSDIDEKVAQNTQFSNWQQMLEKALSEIKK